MDWKQFIHQYQSLGLIDLSILDTCGTLGNYCFSALFAEFINGGNTSANKERLVTYFAPPSQSLIIRPELATVIKTHQKQLQKIVEWNPTLFSQFQHFLRLKIIAQIEHAFNYYIRKIQPNFAQKLWAKLNRKSTFKFSLSDHEWQQLYLVFSTTATLFYHAHFAENIFLMDNKLAIVVNWDKELESLNKSLAQELIDQYGDDIVTLGLTLIEIRIFSTQYIGQLYATVARNYCLERAVLGG